MSVNILRMGFRYEEETISSPQTKVTQLETLVMIKCEAGRDKKEAAIISMQLYHATHQWHVLHVLIHEQTEFQRTRDKWCTEYLHLQY